MEQEKGLVSHGKRSCVTCASRDVCPTVKDDGTYCQDHNEDHIMLPADCWKKSPEHERWEVEQGGVLQFRSGDPKIGAEVTKEMVRRWYVYEKLFAVLGEVLADHPANLTPQQPDCVARGHRLLTDIMAGRV